NIAAAFADFDSDGNIDLAVLGSTGGNVLYRNTGNGKFAAAKNVDIDQSKFPVAVAVGDTNGDGLPDILAGDSGTSQTGSDTQYQNTGGAGENHLVLTLVGTTSNRSAIGAAVLVRVGLKVLLQEVTAGNGQSEGSLPLMFGLGT